MVQESAFIKGTRSEARQFLKKFINQTNGKITLENARRIAWTFKTPKKTIKCNTVILLHGKATEFSTTIKSLDALTQK